MIATGIGTLREGGMRNTAVRVAKEARDRSCRLIIIGLPKNMDGTQGSRADTVRAFGALLSEQTEIPIVYYDERMTTMEAYRYLGQTETYGKRRKEAIDTLSAQIILQDYLAWEKNRKS